MKKRIAALVFYFILTFCASSETIRLEIKQDPELPILFVHGISSNGGVFNQFYEQFAAQGFTTEYLFNALLPRIGIGDKDKNFAWYAYSVTGYDKEQWKNSGNSMYNVPALRQQIDRILASTQKNKLDLISHSNGTAVVRELLVRDPFYVSKIRKCVFISGFPSVSGAGNYNTITTYLYEPDIAAKLPAGIFYYNLTSPADDNITAVERTGSSRLFDLKEVPESINFQLERHDHVMVASSNEAFAKIYSWLTGKNPSVPKILPQVNIGGRIVYYSKPYEQKPKAGVKVKVNYYDPVTGLVFDSALPEVETGNDGVWKVSGVTVKQDCLIQLIITRADKRAKNVYFLASPILNHNLWLNFAEPDLIAGAAKNGQILFNVLTFAEFLSRDGNRGGKAANNLAVKIEAAGVPAIVISGGAALPNGAPIGTITSVCLTNFLPSTVEGGGNIYNFSAGSETKYAHKTVSLLISLYQGKVARPPVKINIHGDDVFTNKIRNHILYLQTSLE